MVIAGAYYPNYFVQGEIDEDRASRELSGFNPRTTVMVSLMAIIIIIIIGFFLLTDPFLVCNDHQNPDGALSMAMVF